MICKAFLRHIFLLSACAWGFRVAACSQHLSCRYRKYCTISASVAVTYLRQLTTNAHRCTTLTLINRITLRTLTLPMFPVGLPCLHRLYEYTIRLLCPVAVKRHRSNMCPLHGKIHGRIMRFIWDMSFPCFETPLHVVYRIFKRHKMSRSLSLVVPISRITEAVFLSVDIGNVVLNNNSLFVTLGHNSLATLREVSIP